MNEKNSDDAIRRASELLLQGATMLQISCPQCSNPIYRLQDGTMICADCNQRVFFERDLSAEQRKQFQQGESPVQKKIENLMRQLEQEEDPEKIIQLAETIKKLREIL